MMDCAPVSPPPSPSQAPPAASAGSARESGLVQASHLPLERSADSSATLLPPSDPSSFHAASAVLASAAVVESRHAPSSAGSAGRSDSGKSLALASAALSQPQGRALGGRDGRDKGQKRGSTPSRAAASSGQGEKLISSPPSILSRRVRATNDMIGDAVYVSSSLPDSAAGALLVSLSAPSRPSSSTAPAVQLSASSHAASSAAPSLSSSSAKGVKGGVIRAFVPLKKAVQAAAPRSLLTDCVAAFASNIASIKVAAPARAAHAAHQDASAELAGAAVVAGAAGAAGADGAAAAASSLASDAVSSASAAIHVPRDLNLAPALANMHCLIFDPARLDAKDEAAQASLKGVLAAPPAEVLPKLLTWLPALSEAGARGACVLSHGNQQRLHVQLGSLSSVHAALAAVPALVRCLPGRFGWQCREACNGAARHSHPEMLELRCFPSGALPKDAAARVPAVRALLAAMQLDSPDVKCVFWEAAKQQNIKHIHEFVAFVLPRLVDSPSLSETISREHKVRRLFGGVVSVRGPNVPVLDRCGDCEESGHRKESCPRFAGAAIRLLFAKPVAIWQIEEPCKSAGARRIYLGRGRDSEQHATHRVVTLLFDVNFDDRTQVEACLQRLEPWLRRVAPLLHNNEVRVVDVSRRDQECPHCGFLAANRADSHTCPFSTHLKLRDTSDKTESSGAPQQGAERASQQSASPAAAQGSRRKPLGPRSSASAGLCREWEKKKDCTAQNTGKGCPFDHPLSHVVAEKPRQACRDHERGKCQWLNCRFAHNDSPQSEAAASASAAAAVASSPAPASPSAAGAPAQPVAAAAQPAPALASASSSSAAAPSQPAALADAGAGPMVPDGFTAVAPTSARKKKSPAAAAQSAAPSPSASTKKRDRGRRSGPGSSVPQARSLSPAVSNIFSALTDEDGDVSMLVRSSSLSRLSSPQSNPARAEKSKGSEPRPKKLKGAAGNAVVVEAAAGPPDKRKAAAPPASAAAASC